MYTFFVDPREDHAHSLSEEYHNAVYRTGRHTLSAPLTPRLLREPQYAAHFQLKNLLQFAPDGRLLYAASEPSAIMALDPHTGEVRSLISSIDAHSTPHTAHCIHCMHSAHTDTHCTHTAHCIRSRCRHKANSHAS